MDRLDKITNELAKRKKVTEKAVTSIDECIDKMNERFSEIDIPKNFRMISEKSFVIRSEQNEYRWENGEPEYYNAYWIFDEDGFGVVYYVNIFDDKFVRFDFSYSDEFYKICYKNMISILDEFLDRIPEKIRKLTKEMSFYMEVNDE